MNQLRFFLKSVYATDFWAMGRWHKYREYVAYSFEDVAAIIVNNQLVEL